MQTDNIVLMFISREELQSLIGDAVRSEFSKKQEKEILSVKDVCELLGIHISTLNKWKAEGIIPFRRLGKRVYFDKEEIKKAMNDNNDKRFDVHSINDI